MRPNAPCTGLITKKIAREKHNYLSVRRDRKLNGCCVLSNALQFWKDYQLTWDPEQFGQIKEELRIDPDRVWRPDIVLFNKSVEQLQVAR